MARFRYQPARQVGRRRSWRGFTLVELLVAVALLSALVAILLPVLAIARANARETTCRSQLHQMTVALRIYADDYDSVLPPPVGWQGQMLQRLRVRPPFTCPGVQNFAYNPRAAVIPAANLIGGYAYNALLGNARWLSGRLFSAPRNETAVRYPATTVAFCDAAFGMSSTSHPDVGMKYATGPGEEGGRRHRGGANYAFLDGHVKWYRPEAVDSSRSTKPPDGAHPSFKPG